MAAAAAASATAAHMRDFVRAYFQAHSRSLVNKDLNSISTELQRAYELEGGAVGGAGARQRRRGRRCG